MKKQYTLGKEERLKSRKQIDHLFQQGRSFNLYPYRVFYSLIEKEEAIKPLSMGVGVSSRNFKRAVDRNRIKRLGREAWRLQKADLQAVLVKDGRQMNIFLLYTGKEIESFELIREKVAAVLNKLIKFLHEDTGSNP